MTKSQFVLISGVTSGIGRSTAIAFANAGYSIIGTGRRAEKLSELREEIIAIGVDCKMLEFDIRERDQTSLAIESLPSEVKRNITIVVNNAGLAAGAETIDKGKFVNWERMIDTNVKGLLWLTESILPYLKEVQNATIINVGSIAGKMAYKGGNVYNASKFAVDALSKAMRIDLLEYGIRVAQICPGAVETEFSLVRYDWDKSKAENVYKGFEPLRPEDVAETILFMATRPPHVCIQDVVIMPTAQADGVHIYKEL